MILFFLLCYLCLIEPIIFLQKILWLATALCLIEKDLSLVGRSLIVSFVWRSQFSIYLPYYLSFTKSLSEWMFWPNAGYDLDDSNAFEPKSVNYASVPPAGAVGPPKNITQSDEPNRNTARNLVAPSLYRYSKFDLIHSLLISLILVFQWPWPIYGPCVLCQWIYWSCIVSNSENSFITPCDRLEILHRTFHE